MTRSAFKSILVILVFIGLALTAKDTYAQSSGRSSFLANLGQGISKKADERYNTRWTLADWFETQRKSRLQDQWLAGNKEDDLYEFYVGGKTGVRTITVDGVESPLRPRSTTGSLGAYATLVGLEGSYLDQAGTSETDVAQNGYGWDGWFAFRPLGDSLQNSNLTLFYGLLFRDDYGGEFIQNSAAKARLTLYVTKAFGLEGTYQWIFKGTSNLGAEIDGAAVEAGAFLDFSLLRIYGAWVRESRTRIAPVVLTKTVRESESVDVGLKVFF